MIHKYKSKKKKNKIFIFLSNLCDNMLLMKYYIAYFCFAREKDKQNWQVRN